MSRLAKLVVITLSVLVLCYVGLGYVLGKTGEDKTYRSLTVFGEVLQHIQQDYVEEPNLPLVTAGALHGLLESLDPMSSYLSPREYTDYKQKLQSGARAEVGATLSKRFGYIVVVSVLPDSPAAKAGLRYGDLLEAIAGFTTREMSVGQAQILLAGQPGTAVKVAVVRRGHTEPQDVELIRAQLAPTHALADKVTPDVAYIRVPALDAGRANEIREKLLQFDRQGIRKLVLDLRDCGRGETSEAVAAARLFLTSGTIGALRGQTVARQEFVAEPGKAVWKHPMTVLISGSTSGAAEILAAGIGGNKRGEVVGTHTFGTASEQKLIELEDGAAVVLTIANYYTPGGKSIAEEGVVPTEVVRAAGEDQADSRDEETPPTPQAEHPAWRLPPPEDPVLRKAIELLKGDTRKAASRLVPVQPYRARASAAPA
ncbi:MAG: PDZ domain-containing protein [Acidobacteria bacterium]|nr:PDZ domain-containing protein [Acidobacteriota bacterium]